jgi:L-2-hydroxyglutarate oxidase LhgO
MAGKSPFRHLIYPVANDGGLGVHVTLDMAGQVRFGPDCRWLSQLDYQFDDSLREKFTAAIRSYFPGIAQRRLQPGYTGIRPRLAGPGESPRDFMVSTEEQHGVAGLVNLYGIESPGLTACLALGEHVADAIDA